MLPRVEHIDCDRVKTPQTSTNMMFPTLFEILASGTPHHRRNFRRHQGCQATEDLRKHLATMAKEPVLDCTFRFASYLPYSQIKLLHIDTTRTPRFKLLCSCAKYPKPRAFSSLPFWAVLLSPLEVLPWW